MGIINRGGAAPTYHDKRNEVLSVADVDVKAVRFTNDEGRESVCLALVFGVDAEDKGPGVLILADEQAMVNQLKVASKTVKAGVRAAIAADRELDAEDIPDHLAGGKSEEADVGSMEVGE